MAIRAADLRVTVTPEGVVETGRAVSNLGNTFDMMASAPARAGASLMDFTSRLGFTVFAVQQLASAGRGLVTSLFDQNVAMQNASARIMAFTKDAGATADILETIRQRAAQTPFAFNEMANAAAGLIPVAKTSGKALEDLLGLAEILAASNPMQGLEGAAFALREAASGDFTSIIERFNLSRVTINRLKAEGVPALEAVQQAMLEMGYDASLVSNLAQTATGRWSTFIDTLQNIKATAMQATFDALSEGLGGFQRVMDRNAETINRFAAAFGRGLAAVVLGAGRGMIAVFNGLAAAVGYFTRESSLLNQIATALALALGVPRGGEQLVGFLNTVSAIFGILTDGVRTFVQALQGDWTSASGILPFHDAIGRLGLLIRNVVAPAASWLARNMGAVQEALQDVLIVANPVASFIGRFVMGLLRGESASDAFRNALTRVGQAYRNVGNLVRRAWEAIDWEAVGSFAMDTLLAGLEGAQDIGGRLLGVIRTAAGEVDWAGVGSTILGWIVDGLQGAGNIGSRLLGAISTAAGEVDWDAVGETVLDGIVDGWDAVTDVGSRFLTYLQGEFDAVDWDAVGETVLDGIVEGITAATDFGTRVAGWMRGELQSADWSGIGRAIANGAMTGLSTVQGWGQRLVGWIARSLAAVQWQAIGTTVANGILVGLTAVQGWGQRVAGWVEGQLRAVDWSAVGQTISNGINTGLSGAAQTNATRSPLMQSLGLDGLLTGIQSVIPLIMPAVSLIGTNLAQAFTSLQGPVQSVKGLFDQVYQSFIMLQPTIMVLAGLLGGVLVAAFVGASALIQGAVNLMAGAFMTATEIIRGSVMVVTGFLYALQSAVAGVVNVVSALLRGDWQGAWEAATEAVSGFREGLALALGGLETIVKGIFNGLEQMIVGTFDIIVETVLEILSGFGVEVGGLLSGAVDTVITVFTTMPGLIATAISGLPAIVAGVFGTLAGEAVGKVSGMVGEVLGWFGNLLGGVPSLMQGVVDSVLGFFQNMWTEATGKVSGMVTEILEKMSGLVTDMGTKGTELMNSLINAIIGLISTAVSVVQSVKDGILGVFGDAISMLSSVGSDIVQGLADGISGAKDKVMAAARELASNLPGWVKKVLGIESPSKVMRDEVGIPIVQGIIAGMGAATPDAVKAAADAARAVLDAFTTALDVGDRLRSGSTLPAQAAVDAFVDMARATLEAVRGVADGFTTEGLELVGKFSTASKGIFDAFAAALGLFSDPARRLPTLADIGALKAVVEHAVVSLRDTAAYIGTEGLDAATAVSEAAGSIFDAFGRVLEAFSGGARPLPDMGYVSALKFLVEHAVVSLRDTALYIGSEGLDAARAFADAAGPLMDVLDTGVQAFDGLARLEAMPTRAAISAFKFLVEHLVVSFRDTALYLTTEGMGAVVAFADAAGAILGFVSDGVDALRALDAGFPAVSQGVATGFKNMVTRVVAVFKDVALQMQGPATAALQEFAAAAGDILGIVEDGVAALQALHGGFPAVSQSVAVGFKNMVVRIVAVFKDAALQMQGPALAAVQEFAAAAGDILGIVGSAVEAFATLATATFSSPATSANLAAFSTFVVAVVQALRTAVGTLGTEGLETAREFADTAGSLFGAISGAVDAFTAMGDEKFIIPALARVDAFIAFLVAAVGKLNTAASVFESDALALGREFADTAGSLFDMIDAAAGFEGIPTLGKRFLSGMDAFLADVTLAVGKLIEVGDRLGAALPKAAEIASQIKEIVDLLNPAGSGGGGGGGGAGGGGGLSGGGARGSRGYVPPVRSTATAGGAGSVASGGSGTQLVIALGAAPIIMDGQKVGQMTARRIVRTLAPDATRL